jgi:eukaryotic-like serine/threonine-protein kinase
MTDARGQSARSGEHVSHYRIIDRIGSGGMGEVYRAEDTRLGREVALKFLPGTLSGRADARARFEREARAASALDQPNICTIYEIDETPDGRLFIAMALYEGETLDVRIARGPLPVSEAVEITRSVARGLERAHSRDIVHRDLKPSNVMLTADGDVKILDFGIAKLSGAEDLTRPGASLGTLDYMAPEQLEGRAIDARTDVWGLGVVLYQMLTGSLPFRGRTVPERIASIVGADPIAPSELRAGIPDALDRLVLEMLARNPSDRVPSMRSVLTRLGEHRQAIRGPHPHGRRRVLASSIGVAVVALAIVAIVLFRSGGASPIDSIAVLPFENASTTADGAYLSDGLTASLTDRLSRIRELRVVPRGVAAAYRGGSDLRATGRSLAVRALVTGRVGEIDNRLVVRAELIDVARMSQIWGAQFDRPLTDILAVQDSLVRVIADQLQLELTSEDSRALAGHATDNPEAYRLYLLGRFHSLSVSTDGLERGLRYAEQAVRLDPAYALGWAGLADSHLARVGLGAEPRDAGYARAKEAAEKAIALDPSLGAGHMELGFIRHHADWDWDGARAEFERAIQLDPASADAQQGISEVMATTGDLDGAVAHAEQAVALDPITPVVSWWAGIVYYWAGRYERSLELLRRSLELEPDNILASMTMPWVLQALGRADDALAAQDTAAKRLGTDPAANPSKALLLAIQGRRSEARAMLEQHPPEPGSLAYAARAWAWLGDFDRAFPLLEQAAAVKEGQLWWLAVEPTFDPLRADPRFAAIRRAIGLTD